MKLDSIKDEKKCDLGSRDRINVRVGINLIRSDLVTLRDTGTGDEPTFFVFEFGSCTGPQPHNHEYG